MARQSSETDARLLRRRSLEQQLPKHGDDYGIGDEMPVVFLDDTGKHTIGPLPQLCNGSFTFEGIEHPNGRIALQMLSQTKFGFPASSSSSSAAPDTSNTFTMYKVLDNGCGSASMTSAIQQFIAQGGLEGKSCEITVGIGSVDIRLLSKVEMMQKARRMGWRNCNIEDIDMQNLRLPSRFYTHVYTNLSVLFCQDDDAAVREVYRVLQPGGHASWSSWRRMGWQGKSDSSIVMDGDAVEDPEALFADPCLLFPANGWRDPDYIRGKLRKHGFIDIVLTKCDLPLQEISAAVRETVTKNSFDKVINSLVRLAVAKLWHEGNDSPSASSQNNDDVEEVVQSVLQMYAGADFGKFLEVWVVSARKPALISPYSPSGPGMPTREMLSFKWT